MSDGRTYDDGRRGTDPNEEARDSTYCGHPNMTAHEHTRQDGTVANAANCPRCGFEWTAS